MGQAFSHNHHQKNKAGIPHHPGNKHTGHQYRQSHPHPRHPGHPIHPVEPGSRNYYYLNHNYKSGRKIDPLNYPTRESQRALEYHLQKDRRR